MKQRDKRFYAALVECAKYCPIVFDLTLIPLTLCWFYTRPLKGESVRVVVEGLGDVEVFAESIVMITANSRDVVLRISCFGFEFFPVGIPREICLGITGAFFRCFLFPFVPIIVGVTLYLMR